MKSLCVAILSMAFAFAAHAQSSQSDIIEGGMYEPAPFNAASVQVTSITPWGEGTNVAEVELSFDFSTNACGGVEFVGFVQDFEASTKGVKAFIPLQSPMTGGCADVVGSEKVKQKILISTHPEKGTKVIKIGKHAYRFNGTSVQLIQ